MATVFSETLTDLRRRRGLSQRAAASALGISQALLSHYENAAREPGLAFLCRACDYYGVSADYLLGRTDEQTEYTASAALRGLARELRELADRAESICNEEDHR